jgi:predicted RecA/RadA family phage recombinase
VQLLYNSGTGTETLTPTPATGVGAWCLDLANAAAAINYGTADAGAVLTIASNNTIGGATGTVFTLDRNGLLALNKYSTAGVLMNDASGNVTSLATALPIANIPTGAVSGNSVNYVPTTAGVVTALASYAPLAGGTTFTGDVTINAVTPSLTLTDTEAGSAATMYYGTTAGQVFNLSSLKTAVGNVMTFSADGALALPKLTTAGILKNSEAGVISSAYNNTLDASDGSPAGAFTVDATGNATLAGAGSTALTVDGTGSAYVNIDRSATTGNTGTMLKNNGTQNWFTGMTGSANPYYTDYMVGPTTATPKFVVQTTGDILLNPVAASGETPALLISGYKAADELRTLSISVGSAVANTASFTGLTTYKFTGLIAATTAITAASYISSGSVVYGASFAPFAAAGDMIFATRAASKQFQFKDSSANVTATIAADTGNATLGTITSNAKPVMVWAGGTAAMADPPGSPVAGWVYKATDNTSYVYTGSGWLALYTAP